MQQLRRTGAGTPPQSAPRKGLKQVRGEQPTVAARLLQAFVEEEQEWQEGIDNSRHRRSTRLISSIKQPQAPVRALSLPDAVLCYCRCMQHMLQVHLPLWPLPLRKARRAPGGCRQAHSRTGSTGRLAAQRWCERGCGVCGMPHMVRHCRRVGRSWS